MTQTIDGVKIHGFRKSKYSCGYIMLCIFARHVLNVYRYPFYEDRVIASIHQHSDLGKELEACVSIINAQRFSEISSEFLSLYNHTQSKLAEANLKTVTLTRRICFKNNDTFDREIDYGHGLFNAFQAATVLGKKTILLDMDTLNSFGDDGGYGHMPITLHLDIPAKDILYCSNLIASANHNDERGDTEPGEWVVINRSPTGVVEIPIEAISINENIIKKVFKMTEKSAKLFLDSYTPLQLRCAPNARMLNGLFYDKAYKPTFWERLRIAWRAFNGKY